MLILTQLQKSRHKHEYADISIVSHLTHADMLNSIKISRDFMNWIHFLNRYSIVFNFCHVLKNLMNANQRILLPEKFPHFYEWTSLFK